MTSDHILSMVPRLRARDVHELTGIIRGSLEDWARSRLTGTGIAYALVHRGEVWICGGVLEGAVRGVGAIWFVCAEGWEHYVRHLLVMWRLVQEHAGFRRIEAKCYADNEVANRFALHTGFRFEGTLRGYTVRGEDVNQYGKLIGGSNGR